MEKMPIRFVKANGRTYLSAADVAAYIEFVAATEETTVRRRLQAAAQYLVGCKRSSPHAYLQDLKKTQEVPTVPTQELADEVFERLQGFLVETPRVPRG